MRSSAPRGARRPRPTRRAGAPERSAPEPDPAVEPGGRVDVEHPHRRRAGVAEAVRDAGRDEHEGARAGRRGLGAEEEDHLALEDVERVVLRGVDVLLELTARRDLDDAEVEARALGGAGEELEFAAAGPRTGRDNDRRGPVHGGHTPGRSLRAAIAARA